MHYHRFTYQSIDYVWCVGRGFQSSKANKKRKYMKTYFSAIPLAQLPILTIEENAAATATATATALQQARTRYCAWMGQPPLAYRAESLRWTFNWKSTSFITCSMNGKPCSNIGYFLQRQSLRVVATTPKLRAPGNIYQVNCGSSRFYVVQDFL